MIDERLLLATALVHSCPGAHLVAQDASGRGIAVGPHPSADLDPCRWRAQVIAAIDGRRSPAGERWTLASVGGTLEAASAGGFRDLGDPLRRWFSARLPACLAVAVLRSIDLGGVPEASISAVVRPDLALGVTTVGVGVADDHVGALDHLAATAAGAWVVAELCYSLTTVEG